MGGSPRTITEAWDIFLQLRHDRRVILVPDLESVDTMWRTFMTQSGAGPSSWTDAYLAAFAETHSCRVVTFDKGFARWSDLKFVLLSSPPEPVTK